MCGRFCDRTGLVDLSRKRRKPERSVLFLVWGPPELWASKWTNGEGPAGGGRAFSEGRGKAF